MHCPACFHDNPDDARFCNQCAQSLNDQTAPQAQHVSDRAFATRSAIEGERKLVSVLFADVKGSTELVADVDPEIARRVLDPVLVHMMEAVRHYGGTVNQLTGDGVMALFGAPIAQEDHASRACAAAIRIQRNLAQHRDKLHKEDGTLPLPRARVGINSGEVLVRSLSTDLHLEYTAVGLTTHLAARMEQMATPGSVFLTAATLQLAAGTIEVQSQGLRVVAGLAEPVQVFELTRAEETRTRPTTDRSPRLRPFVGRETEMGWLSNVSAVTADGYTRAILVIGDAGVGKSRLLEEFVDRNRASGAQVHRVGCITYGPATEYASIASLVRSCLSVEPGDEGATVLAKTSAFLEALDLSQGLMATALLALLDVLPAESPSQRLDPTQRRHSIVEILKRLVQKQCDSAPLILVLEDLEGVDSESLAVLDALLQVLPRVRLLVLATCRSGAPISWLCNPVIQRLDLKPLTSGSAARLLDVYLGPSEDLEQLRQQLTERTQGNPLFIEECVSALREAGTLIGTEGALKAGLASKADKVPATVRAIIAARIDRLTDSDARLLQAASILGGEFSLELLQLVGELDNNHRVQSALERLQVSGFLSERTSQANRIYSFKHALTHEVCYSSLLGERRRELHRRALSAVESLHAEHLDEHVEMLAHHAVQSGLTDKAINYMKRAAERAVARSAFQDAARFYQNALDLINQEMESPDTLATALSIRLGLGFALRSTNAADDRKIEACYAGALRLCDRLGDRPERFPALLGLWACQCGSGEYDLASQTAFSLQELAATGTSHMKLEASHANWSTGVATGRMSDALSWIARSRNVVSQAEDITWGKYSTHHPIMCGHQMSSIANWTLGSYEQARADVSHALRRATKVRHPLTTVLAHQTAAVVHYHCGDRGTATLHAKTASSLGRLHGITGLPEQASIINARLLADDDRMLEAVRLVDENLAGARHAGWAWRSSISLGLAAEIYALSGQHGRSLDLLRSLQPAHYNSLYGPELHRLYARLLLSGPDANMGEAETRLYVARDLARKKDLKSLQLRIAIDLANCLAIRNRSAAREALSIVDEFGELSDAADLRRGRALKKWLS